ncbi:MAG: hypothetical protein ACR2HX_17075 [Pyrinomonadaceae bacterium]
MAEKSRVPWLSIVLTGLLAFVFSIAVTAAIVAGYAFALGMQARDAPDPIKIAAFAGRVIPILGPLLLSLLVLFAARRVVRRAKSPQLWHGVLVGVMAALPTLMFIRSPGLADVVGLLLPLPSGLLGAFWAMTRWGRIEVT